MINVLLVLLWCLSIFFIYYFWKRKPNNRKKWFSVIACIVLFFAIGLLPSNRQVTKSDNSSISSRSSSTISSATSSGDISSKRESSTKKTTDSSTKKRNKIQAFILKKKAERLELGTSKKEVIKKLGNPDQNNGQMLLYNNFNLYFENNKLVGGDLPAIQKKVDKKREKDKENRKNQKEQLIGFAQSFGRKPVDTIQSMPSTYTSDHVENNMVYTWHPEGMPMLVRVDSPENYTTVYKYDKNGEHGALGETLYKGRTIYQKSSNYNNNYDY